jgi:hypothetical protein
VETCFFFLWWFDPLPPAPGSTSQYWSIPDVPAGAWQFTGAADALAGRSNAKTTKAGKAI